MVKDAELIDRSSLNDYHDNNALNCPSVDAVIWVSEFLFYLKRRNAFLIQIKRLRMMQ